MAKVTYIGISKAEAWDEQVAMAEFRSRMIALAGKWRPTSPEANRYHRIARAIDDCAQDWGFNAADLYACGDATSRGRLDRNPYR